jgi:lipid-A-disaccharide synthase
MSGEAGRVDLLIIAGEHSGDEHAARLVEKALKLQPGMKVAAIGGERLREAGAHMLYNPLDSAVIGLVEVIRHFSYLKALFDQTAQWIGEHRPKVVCFVDYPGFNLRLARLLFEKGIASKAGGNVRLAYYISPQIWAWKSKRRFAMARHLDALGVIFPFELQSYRDTDLKVDFVGHPFVDPGHELPVRYDPQGPLLLLPGSRKTPVQRLFPVMLQAFRRLRRLQPELRGVCLYPTENLRLQLASIAAEEGVADALDLEPNTRTGLAVRGVITSSGTISLVCALAAIPGILIYRTSTLTYLLAKWLVKIQNIGIANIILGETIHPEYLQIFQPATLAQALESRLHDPAALARTRELAAMLKNRLHGPDPQAAARWLLEQISGSPE